MAFSISSTAFKDGGTIPSRYTCDEEGISPPLAWSAPPESTKALVLIMEDLDAPGGIFVHWVISHIPPALKKLDEGVKAREQASAIIQGKNSTGSIGYMAPCPPSGKHRYVITLYAIDQVLPYKAGASKQQVLDIMRGHILAQSKLIGVYQRHR